MKTRSLPYKISVKQDHSPSPDKLLDGIPRRSLITDKSFVDEVEDAREQFQIVQLLYLSVYQINLVQITPEIMPSKLCCNSTSDPIWLYQAPFRLQFGVASISSYTQRESLTKQMSQLSILSPTKLYKTQTKKYKSKHI